MTNVKHDAPPPSLSRVVVLLIALMVLIPRLSGLYTIHIFDDAFITFRHADNLATGRGLTFNVGTHVLGTTSPLFAVLLAGARVFGLDIPATAQTIGIVSDIVTALLTFSVVGRQLGTVSASLAVLLFAIDPHIIRVAVGGMESSLFLMLSLIVLTLLRDRPGLAFVIASAACWIRPEGGVLWLASLGALALTWRKTAAWAWLTAGVAIAILPAALIYLHYGALLSQSVASKSHMPSGGLSVVLELFFYPPGNPLQWMLTVLMPLGIAVCVQRRALLGPMLWIAIYVAAYAVAHPPMWTWYGLPVYWAKSVFSGIAIAWAVTKWTPRTLMAPRPALGVGLAIAVLVGIVSAIIFGASPVRRGVYEPLRVWCPTHLTGQPTVAAGDVGVLGYYCDVFVYDLAGLVWPEYRNYRDHLEVVEEKQPDYIFAETGTYWRSLHDPNGDLRKRYEPVARFSRFLTSDLNVRPEDLTPFQRQDYILYRRIRP